MTSLTLTEIEREKGKKRKREEEEDLSRIEGMKEKVRNRRNVIIYRPVYGHLFPEHFLNQAFYFGVRSVFFRPVFIQ